MQARIVANNKGQARAIHKHTVKKGLDMIKCLLEEKLVKPLVPTLEDDQLAHNKRVLEYRMGELMKSERILEGNICNPFMLLMSDVTLILGTR